MIQEILLSLSGISSPIWNQAQHGSNDANNQFQQYVSAPEQAMLHTLSNISELHIHIRTSCASISASHPSTICRAVSTTISSIHLREFQKKIIEVEKSILMQDAEYVGAYNIVPLSTLVTEFTPWERRLRWLTRITGVMEKKDSSKKISSSELLDLLVRETHTGYYDIEKIATELLVVGQRAWLQLVTPWIIYGKLPSFGSEDFMIQNVNKTSEGVVLQRHLTPNFVTAEAADTVLAIGQSLNQMRSGNYHTSSMSVSGISSSKVSSHSLGQLKGLAYPLQPAVLEQCFLAINDFVSQNALSQLLPLTYIMEILMMFQNYVFLGNGEFTLLLLTHAQERLIGRSSDQNSNKPVRRLGQLEDMVMKDTEISSILSKTWSELATLQAKSESEDPVFMKAKNLLQLKRVADSEDLVSTLLPVASALDIAISAEDPISLFLADRDRELAHRINSFLCSIRRADMRLSNMWKLTSHRRYHPAPLGPPMSTSRRGQELLRIQRKRNNGRVILMRRHWVTVSRTLFVVAELGHYFHEEVIEKNWQHFQDWLYHLSNPRPTSASLSRPMTASSASGRNQISNSAIDQVKLDDSGRGMRSDPRTIARAHRVYLENITLGLLLHQKPFISILRELLRLFDHYIALFERLQIVWEGLDLQEDEGVEDAFSNYVQDEKELLQEMDSTRDTIESSLQELVKNIKTAEKERGITDMTTGVASTGLSNHNRVYTPLKLRTLDRLIMKLDFLTAGENEDDDGIQDLLLAS